MTIFFTSDPHFGHENIIKYAARPFANAEEMNEALIERWNDAVRPQDHVYCLGDLTMERGSAGSSQAHALIRLCKRLNGHKRLILGNHDHFPVSVYVEAGFQKIRASNHIDGLQLTHIPIHPASMGRFAANVHGHTHDVPDYAPVYADKKPQYYFNVSVERTAYAPVAMEEIQDWVKMGRRR